jgi:hypothetical protein
MTINWWALHEAAVRGDLGEIKALTDRHPAAVSGKDILGWDLLMHAAGRGHTEGVAYLLRHDGVDVDACDKHGQTALFHACWAGQVEVAEVLLEAGADVFVVNVSGQTALDAARLVQSADCVDLLQVTMLSLCITYTSGPLSRQKLLIIFGNRHVCGTHDRPWVSRRPGRPPTSCAGRGTCGGLGLRRMAAWPARCTTRASHGWTYGSRHGMGGVGRGGWGMRMGRAERCRSGSHGKRVHASMRGQVRPPAL